ncbi:MAG: cytidylate kinase family protein [Eisenbergiella sp.]
MVRTDLRRQPVPVQSEVIRKLAAEESCVIIGRCANYVPDGMEGLLRVYL